MEILVEQIVIIEGGAFVTGRPTNDRTKVVIGAAETRGAMLMAIELQAGPVVVDMPDFAVVQILEVPPPQEG